MNEGIKNAVSTVKEIKSVTKSGVMVGKRYWFDEDTKAVCASMAFGYDGYKAVFHVGYDSCCMTSGNSYGSNISHDQQIEIFAAVIECIKELKELAWLNS